MKKKRSKFFTFVFSLLPGAGHMFMGFMKKGISLMSLFFFVIFLSSWLDIAPFLFILPVLWFYSFFDCLNTRYSSDAVFDQLEDNYLFFPGEILSGKNGLFKKYRLYMGIILIFFGLYILWHNFIYVVRDYAPSYIFNPLDRATNLLPQLIISGFIVFIGIKLIYGKKKESDKNA